MTAWTAWKPCEVCGRTAHEAGVCNSCIRMLSETERFEWAQYEVQRKNLIDKIRENIAAAVLRGDHFDNPIGDSHVLAFPRVCVPAKSVSHLTVQSYDICRPRILRLSDECAKSFQINSIRVGNFEQLSAPVQGEFLAAFSSPLHISVLGPSMNFSMTVENKTDTDRFFEALWEIERLQS